MNLDELNSLLPRIKHWFAENDGIYCVCSANDTEEHQCIAYTELDAIHPQLSTAVQHIALHEQHRYQQRKLLSELLRAQVKHLTAPIVVTTFMGNARGILEVEQITWLPSDEYVRLHAVNYLLRDTLPSHNGDTKKVPPFVDKVTYNELKIPCNNMDIQYPGWRERYATAEALDCTSVERARLVCVESTTIISVGASLPDTLINP